MNALGHLIYSCPEQVTLFLGKPRTFEVFWNAAEDLYAKGAARVVAKGFHVNAPAEGFVIVESMVVVTPKQPKRKVFSFNGEPVRCRDGAHFGQLNGPQDKHYYAGVAIGHNIGVLPRGAALIVQGHYTGLVPTEYFGLEGFRFPLCLTLQLEKQ